MFQAFIGVKGFTNVDTPREVGSGTDFQSSIFSDMFSNLQVVKTEILTLQVSRHSLGMNETYKKINGAYTQRLTISLVSIFLSEEKIV